jgi:hypothetical protein
MISLSRGSLIEPRRLLGPLRGERAPEACAEAGSET